MGEADPAQDPMVGKMLGEYVVRRLIGRGGMGKVWEGYDPDLDRSVAIKVILPDLSNDPTFSERLRREAKLVAALRQQNIVQIYDFDIVDGQAIMVMEFLAGGSLRDRLARYQNAGQLMPLATAADLLDAVGTGLDYAHAKGAVHRDLKPGNILFSDQEQPIIGDFGVAKVVRAYSSLATPTLAAPGSILGTPAYMSPEQASAGEIDHRSDLYSLGIVLYEIVTGRVPFTGASPTEILNQHLHHAPPAPRVFNPNLSEAVEEVLLRALAKEPAARFASASEMSRALRMAAQLDGRVTEANSVVSPLPLQQPAAEPKTVAEFETVAEIVKGEEIKGEPDAASLVNTVLVPRQADRDVPSVTEDAPTVVIQPEDTRKGFP